MSESWEPRIVGFFCTWCTYTAADLAGVSRMKYAPNIRVVRVMCSGRVDPQFLHRPLQPGGEFRHLGLGVVPGEQLPGVMQ